MKTPDGIEVMLFEFKVKTQRWKEKDKKELFDFKKEYKLFRPVKAPGEIEVMLLEYKYEKGNDVGGERMNVCWYNNK